MEKKKAVYRGVFKMDNISIRENYLLAARGKKPLWVPSYMEDCNVFRLDFWKEIDPVTDTDFCNVKWVENEFGRMPREKWRAIKDISEWRNTIKFPDLSKIDWEGIAARTKAAGSPDKVNLAMLNTHGIFLIPVNMMGWVDALCSIYTDPDELEEIVSTITDFLVELVGYEVKYFQPDIICTGDDVASATGPFISKEIWSSMYKPYFRKICDAIKEQDVLIQFHCCGNCQWLISEFLDLGVDICELPVPNESLLSDKKKYGNRLVMTGGWDRQGPGAVYGASEEVVRQSVRTAIDNYGKDGALIFWDGGICGKSDDAQNKRKWVYDELHTYGRTVY